MVFIASTLGEYSILRTSRRAGITARMFTVISGAGVAAVCAAAQVVGRMVRIRKRISPGETSGWLYCLVGLRAGGVILDLIFWSFLCRASLASLWGRRFLVGSFQWANLALEEMVVE